LIVYLRRCFYQTFGGQDALDKFHADLDSMYYLKGVWCVTTAQMIGSNVYQLTPKDREDLDKYVKDATKYAAELEKKRHSPSSTAQQGMVRGSHGLQDAQGMSWTGPTRRLIIHERLESYKRGV
jgi:hypothetical protein